MINASVLIERLGLDELYEKYTIKETCIGSGSYGFVYLATDKLTNDKFAIKMYDKVPTDTVDLKRMYREIRVLHMLQGREFTIPLTHITSSKDGENNLKGLALIFEFQETDLSRIINSTQALSIPHFELFMQQILLSVHYMHSAHLVHRDLKPANILINADCSIKICDFGLARATRSVINEEQDADEVRPPSPLYRKLTHYVVTLWYRSPELILQNSDAGEPPADMWSLGCILAELILRRPLFERCRSFTDVMIAIIKLLGAPAEEDYAWVENPRARRYLSDIISKVNTPPSFATVFADKDPEALDLIQKLLHFNPAKRLTARQALEHPFISRNSSSDLNPQIFTTNGLAENDLDLLHAYYSLERETDQCAQSDAINLRLHSLIASELERYSPVTTANVTEAATSSAASHTDVTNAEELAANVSTNTEEESKIFEDGSVFVQPSTVQSTIFNPPQTRTRNKRKLSNPEERIVNEADYCRIV